MKPRTILTPVSDIELSVDGGRSFWKRVLNADSINYKDRKGNSRRIDFAQMIPDLVNSFRANILPRTPFVLADKDNAHTMDPERERGDVTKMCDWNDLPQKVKDAFIAKEGAPVEGLYTKIRFPTEQAAAAVLNSGGRLAVSARIREGFEAPDGRTAPAAVIHVLGTSDPKLGNLGDWSEDADLSVYASGDVIDLSNATYSEAPVSKNKAKGGGTIDLATLTDDDVKAGKVTNDDLAAMTDEQIAEFVEKFSHLTDDDPEDDPEDDDDSEDPDDDDQETQLSAQARRDIELANARAERAENKANETARRLADREWKTRKRELLGKGIPAHLVDLAAPYISRPEALVIDLSNTSFGGDKAAEVGAVIEELLLAHAGTIEMDTELGHYSPGDSDDAEGDLDAELEKQFDASFPHLTRTR